MSTLLDELNRRSISIQQFATYLLNTYSLPSIEEARKAARRILLDAEEITSRTQLSKIIADVNREISPVLTRSLDGITTELNALAVAEAAFLTEVMREFAAVNISETAKKKVERYIKTGLMSLESGSSSIAGTWADFAKQNELATQSATKAAIQTGYSRGETVSRISKRIKAAFDGVVRNQAETLVRTGVQHMSQQGYNAWRDDNLDVLAREMPITTWDSSRSAICTSVEAKYGVNGSISKGWKVGKSPIGYPPYHPNCRTIVRALPDGVELEGERPAIAGKKGESAEEAFERKEKLADKRLEKGGSGVVKYTGRKDKAFEAELIPVDTKLSKFLKSQPIWYVHKLLGKTKGDAFLSGKLDLSKLTDKNLKPLTLEELNL